ncbi:MAG: YkgJ family cysteine cluster protein [Acetatifactor sp.]|nr:YkgJ family cysteine cluster protein [Acetatifactor sp.]
MCSNCCFHTEGVLLNPKDVYNISKELGLSPQETIEQYCETYIGVDLRMPIVRLKPRGSVQRCPSLKNHKCSVHKAKPAVCAMFPIGRCLKMDEKEVKDITTDDILYIF